MKTNQTKPFRYVWPPFYETKMCDAIFIHLHRVMIKGLNWKHWPCLLQLQQFLHTLNHTNEGWASLSNFACSLQLWVQTFPPPPRCTQCWFKQTYMVVWKSQLSLSFMSNHSFCKPALLGICLLLRSISQTVFHGLIPRRPRKIHMFPCHGISPQLCVQAESWWSAVETFLEESSKIYFYGFSNNRFLKEGVLPLAAKGN